MNRIGTGFASLKFVQRLMLRRWRASCALCPICEECCREYSIVEPAKTKAAVPALRQDVLDRSLSPRLQEMHGGCPRTVCSTDGDHGGRDASVRFAAVGGGRLRPHRDVQRRLQRESGGVMMIATLAHREGLITTKDVVRPSEIVEPCVSPCGASAFAWCGRARAGFATRSADELCGGLEFAQVVCTRPQNAVRLSPAAEAPGQSARKLLVCLASRKRQSAERAIR